MLFGPPARIYMYPSAGYDFSYLEAQEGPRQPTRGSGASAERSSSPTEQPGHVIHRRDRNSEARSTNSRQSTSSRISQFNSRVGNALTGGVFGMLGKHYEASLHPESRPHSNASSRPGSGVGKRADKKEYY